MRTAFVLQSSAHDTTRQATDREEGEAPRSGFFSPIHVPKMEQTNGLENCYFGAYLYRTVNINVQVGLKADLQYIEYRQFFPLVVAR